MTPERIKEIAGIRKDAYQITSGDMQAIVDAASGSQFLLIYYAYSYGFLRGQRYEKRQIQKKEPSE